MKFVTAGVSLIIVSLLGAKVAAQGTFGDFGINLTKLSDDIVVALRTEVRALRPCMGFEKLQDQIRFLEDKLTDLTNVNAICQTDVPALRNEYLEFNKILHKQVSSTKEARAPPLLKDNGNDATSSPIGPQGALAYLLAVSTHSKKPSTMANPAWQEKALYYLMLVSVILYLIVLTCVYCKRGVDSQLREEQQRHKWRFRNRLVENSYGDKTSREELEELQKKLQITVEDLHTILKREKIKAGAADNQGNTDVVA